jgi:hypothetical protein
MLRQRMSRLVAGALLAAGAVGGTTYWLEAREPLRVPNVFRTEEKPTMHSGRVEKLLKNDHGDVDGLQFADGFDVHFPPHVGKRVVELIETGAEASVWGRKETLPRGEVVFEASRIESGKETIQVDRPRPPAGPGAGPRGRRGAEQPMNATGTIADFTSNHHGDVDGLLLADDTEVKFPPHLGEQLQSIVKVGDKIEIEGRRHVTPHGDIHLHADQITAPGGKTWSRDEFAGRRPAPPEPTVNGRDRAPQPTNAEVMKELTAIRRMLEDLKR